ncbi:MAG: hypothetical protein R2861_15755 [Desulfobacterales bacterium]
MAFETVKISFPPSILIRWEELTVKITDISSGIFVKGIKIIQKSMDREAEDL